MSQHTKGPWHVGNGCRCRIYSPDDGHAIARTYGEELNGIGVCELTGGENEADARLIAQSPAMLEELESAYAMLSELLEFLRAMGGMGVSRQKRSLIAKRVNSIRNVILDATGMEPSSRKPGAENALNVVAKVRTDAEKTKREKPKRAEPKSPGSIIRPREAAEYLGTSRTTLYRLVNSGELPKPIKLSTQVTGWRMSTLDQFIAERQGGAE